MLKNVKAYFLSIVIFFILLTAQVYAQSNKTYLIDSLKVKALLVTADNCVKSASANCSKALNEALKISNALASPYLKSLCYKSLADAEKRNKTAFLYKYDSLSVANARLSNNDSLLILCLLNQSHNFCSANKPENAKHLLQEAFLLLGQKENTYLMMVAKYEQGLYFLRSRNIGEAGKNYSQALNYANKINDQYWIAILHRSVYFTNILGYKKSDSTISIFNALEYLRKKNPFEAANCLFIIGYAYNINGNTEKAGSYFNEAALLFKKEKYHLHEADMYGFITEHCILKKEIEKGLYLTGKSERIFVSLGYRTGIINSYMGYGRLYGAAGNIIKSDLYFNKADSVLKISPDKMLNGLLMSYKAMRNINNGYAGVKDKQVDSAAAAIVNLLPKQVTDSMISRAATTGLLSKAEARDLKKYTRTGKLDTLLWNRKPDLDGINPYTGDQPRFNGQYNELFNQQMTEMETKYRTKIKDDSLRNVINENKISQLEINKRNWLIFLISLITIAATIIFYQLNQHLLNTAKRILQEKKTIEIFKAEADHRVQNTLSNINAIIHIVKSQSNDKLHFNLLEERIDPLMLLYHKLTINKDESIGLQDYFEDICSRLKKGYGNTYVEVNVSAPNVMGGKTASLAGLIVNELVTNSFKYAFKENQPGIINIVCDKDEQNEYKLQVSDSGCGFKTLPGNTGSKGLLLVRALAAQMRARVTEKTEGGVCFEFYFKEKPII